MAYSNSGTNMQNVTRAFAMIVGVVALGVTVIYPVPIGLSAYVTLLVIAVAWPKPEMMPIGSSNEKSARYIKALLGGLIHLRNGTLGFGDPGTARGHDRTSKPPNRISAWAAVYLAVLISTLDLHLYTFIHTHNPVAAILGLPFGFIIGQGLAHAARETAADTADNETGPPALYEPGTLRSLLTSSIPLPVAGGGAGLVVGLLFTSLTNPPLPLTIWTIALMAAGGAVAPPIRRYVTASLTEWRSELQTRAEWQERWSAIPRAGTNPPTWILEHNLPQPTISDPTLTATHTAATFAIPPGADFGFFEEAAAKLGPALGSDMILVAPMPAIDETGRPIPGSTQYSGFTVTWAQIPLGQKPHLRTDLDQLTQKFAIRWAVVSACKALGLGRPELAAMRPLNAQNTDGFLIETQWKLDPSVTYDKIAAKAGSLQEKLEVPWLRIGRRTNPDGRPSEFISIVFGQHPDNIKLRPRDAKHLREWIDQLDWAAWSRAARLVGTNGQPPQLLDKQVNDREIAEMLFTVPDGFSVADVKKQVPALMGTSGHGYIAIETLEDATRFRMVAGRYDPLAQPYLFTDYPDLLRKPEPGRPRLDWAIGPGADGELMTYKWDSELPHMLIAGGSGMGKSSVLNAMILQMAHNSDPKDLQFRFIEPKNELGQFANFEHVTHYIDSQSPGEPMENVANLYEELRVEMDRRYAVMARHGALKLSDARFIARREGRSPNGEPHPLDMPYIVCVMEECATYLGRPLKKDRELHETLLVHTTELARKARAAGIYLVFATQYPTNENLPSTIRQQCRRVGLGVSTQIASMVIIDEPGLEEINIAGRGLMTYGKGYREFRALYLRKPDEEHPDEPDDRAAIMTRIPQVQDRVFAAAGTGRSSTLLPPPEDIWDVDG